jgi:hypothetical protein
MNYPNNSIEWFSKLNTLIFIEFYSIIFFRSILKVNAGDVLGKYYRSEECRVKSELIQNECNFVY